MATNPLHENLQTAKVGNLYADAYLIDLTAYLPKHDGTKVNRVCKYEQERNNERVMGLSDPKQSAPTTTTKTIDTIEMVDTVSCLVINAANITTTCVDVTAMTEMEARCLLIGLTEHCLDLMSSNFRVWVHQKYNGGSHVQLTLFTY